MFDSWKVNKGFQLGTDSLGHNRNPVVNTKLFETNNILGGIVPNNNPSMVNEDEVLIPSKFNDNTVTDAPVINSEVVIGVN